MYYCGGRTFPINIKVIYETTIKAAAAAASVCYKYLHATIIAIYFLSLC
jgi:hypothetical protein